MSNSQLNKLKSTLKNGTEVTLNPSSNLIGSSNDETTFPHKLLLTNTQVSKICKVFANGSSTDIKFSKTQLPKIIQSGRFIFGSANIFDSGISNPLIALIKGLNSLMDSSAKESKNMGAFL